MKHFKKLSVPTIAFLLVLSVQVNAQTNRADSLINMFTQRHELIMVAAHRCAHEHYPENSIAALEETIRLGIDIAEIDIRETKDHVLVVIHDDKVDRTTTGKGAVKDYTYAQLSELSLLHDGKPTSQKVPTLEKMLLLAKGKILLDLDFKLDDETALKNTYKLIAETGTTNQILFFLYKYKYMKQLYDLNPKISIMPRAYNAEEANRILALNIAKVIHIDESYYSDSFMEKMRSKQVRIWSNALGKYDDMESSAKNSGFQALLTNAKYVNIIQTNLPQELLLFLKSSGKHP